MRLRSAAVPFVILAGMACSAGGAGPSSATGGSAPTGGQSSSGGSATGGASSVTGGTATTTGGAVASATGGSGGAGAASGGSAGLPTSNAGASTGGSGAATGGASNAGAAGSSATGGSAAGGSAGQAQAGGGSGGGFTGGMILLKDNFDASTVGSPPDVAKWMAPVVGDNNQPTIDAGRAHSLPNAAKVQASSTGNSFLVFTSALPTANNRVYVRAFVNFEKAISAITGHVGFIVGAASRDNSGTELRFGSSTPPGFSGSMLDVNLQNPMDNGGGEVTRFSNGYTTGGEPLNMAGKTLDANHWYCIEALYSGTPSEFNLWIDGTELTLLHVTDFDARGTTPRTMWAPSFKFLKFGAQNYGGDAGQLWYDDIVIGTERVGCAL